MVSHSSLPLAPSWELCLDVAAGPGLILEPDLTTLLGWSPPGAVQSHTGTTLAPWTQSSGEAVATLLPQPCPLLSASHPPAVTGDAAVPALVFTGPENKSEVCEFFLSDFLSLFYCAKLGVLGSLWWNVK